MIVIPDNLYENMSALLLTSTDAVRKRMTDAVTMPPSERSRTGE